MPVSVQATLSPEANAKIVQQIADELGVAVRRVAAAVDLLNEGATVPFIARYRKEATGNLDDTQLRELEVRLVYLRELEDRRAAILASLEEQGKLTETLRQSILVASTKQVLEDLYLPFKPKRRTRAQIAREAGIELVADALLRDPALDPESEATRFIAARPKEHVDPATDVFGTPKAVLEGARDILAERFGETAELIGKVRDRLVSQGVVTSALIVGQDAQHDQKFQDYYGYQEPLRTIPSHRALAIFRGRAQGVLAVKLGLGDAQELLSPHPCEALVAEHFDIVDLGRAADRWLKEVCRWTWRVKLSPHIEHELLSDLKERAQKEAIKIFGRNVHDLLLAAPAGAKVVLGIDPGIRTGCKVAVVDATGRLLETQTIYPHPPRLDWEGALAILARMVSQHRVELIAIGNGTASRETDRLVVALIARMGDGQPHRQTPLAKVVVSEAGASVYSASESAAREFPELDVTLRGAVSIARRLQDPLAELVKIDPKAIGVGQYQHDVNQRELAQALDRVVEDCVNAVGVDVNTASTPLLARVSGLNVVLAKNIVEFRDRNGPYANREVLKQVPRLGEKAFQQAAGFLRINRADDSDAQPLDRTAVHPESYPVVEKILARLGKGILEVMGQPGLLEGMSPTEFTDTRFGLPTVRDVFAELEKPGRDPRPEFKAAQFLGGVESITDLRADMILEGVVTNVAAFGAFVDVGVHQDGLVHVSALAARYVKNPHDVVKPGQIVRVKVLEVDVKRQRIALTMRLEEASPAIPSNRPSDTRSSITVRHANDVKTPAPEAGTRQGTSKGTSKSTSKGPSEGTSAMALAFARLKR